MFTQEYMLIISAELIRKKIKSINYLVRKFYAEGHKYKLVYKLSSFIIN